VLPASPVLATTSEANRVAHDDLKRIAIEAGLDPTSQEITNIGMGADGWHVGVMEHFIPVAPTRQMSQQIERVLKMRGATLPVHVEPGMMTTSKGRS
jgi:hypothetical protein